MTEAPDLPTIDALAQLQLAALRLGISLSFRVDAALVELATLVGLDEVLDVAVAEDPHGSGRTRSGTLTPMARYMVERSFGAITEEEMLAAGLRSDQAIREHFPGITWEHSHVCVEDDGNITTFCVYEAPSQEAVREHASVLGGHTILRISEIADDVTPAVVRQRAGLD